MSKVSLLNETSLSFLIQRQTKLTSNLYKTRRELTGDISTNKTAGWAQGISV